MKFDKLQWMIIKDTVMDVVESLPILSGMQDGLLLDL